MNLVVLAVLVIGGIALVVLAVHRTGGSLAHTFAGTAEAEEAFARDHPNRDILETHLADDRTIAFMKLDAPGRVGLVQVFGRHWMTRDMSVADLVAPVLVEGSAITLRTRDFTWKGGTFTFAHPASARDVAGWFAPPVPSVRPLERSHGSL